MLIDYGNLNTFSPFFSDKNQLYPQGQTYRQNELQGSLGIKKRKY